MLRSAALFHAMTLQIDDIQQNLAKFNKEIQYLTFENSVLRTMAFLNKYTFFVLFIACFVIAKEKDNEELRAWKKKKITDYSDADMERLLDQWNVSEVFRI